MNKYKLACETNMFSIKFLILGDFNSMFTNVFNSGILLQKATFIYFGGLFISLRHIYFHLLNSNSQGVVDQINRGQSGPALTAFQYGWW